MLFLKMLFLDIVPVRKRFSLFKLCRANQPLGYRGEAVIKIRYYVHGRKTAKFCPLYINWTCSILLVSDEITETSRGPRTVFVKKIKN